MEILNYKNEKSFLSEAFSLIHIPIISKKIINAKGNDRLNKSKSDILS